MGRNQRAPAGGGINMEIKIDKIIENYISEMDLAYLVKAEIINLISKDVRNIMNDIIEKQAKEIVLSEIKNYLDGPIKTDDGWGKKNEWPSLQEMFKTVLHQKMNDHYDIKREIKNQVENRIDKWMKGQWSEVVKKVIDEVLQCSSKKS